MLGLHPSRGRGPLGRGCGGARRGPAPGGAGCAAPGRGAAGSGGRSRPLQTPRVASLTQPSLSKRWERFPSEIGARKDLWVRKGWSSLSPLASWARRGCRCNHGCPLFRTAGMLCEIECVSTWGSGPPKTSHPAAVFTRKKCGLNLFFDLHE